MSPEKETPENSSSSETTAQGCNVRPFEVAALATAMWMFRTAYQEPSHIGYSPQRIEPKDYIEDACALLSEAGKVLARELAEEALNKAVAERKSAEGVYESAKEYLWKDVLECQRKDVQDRSSLAKFFPDKEWHRLKSKVKTGEFYFTEKDLTNRPQGFSMLGTITTDEGLRKAIKRLLPGYATRIVKSKMLKLWQINEILVDQLNRNHGKTPAPRDTKTSPA